MQLTKTIYEKRLASLDFYNYKLLRTDSIINEHLAKKPEKYIPHHFDFQGNQVDLISVV